MNDSTDNFIDLPDYEEHFESYIQAMAEHNYGQQLKSMEQIIAGLSVGDILELDPYHDFEGLHDDSRSLCAIIIHKTDTSIITAVTDSGLDNVHKIEVYDEPEAINLLNECQVIETAGIDTVSAIISKAKDNDLIDEYNSMLTAALEETKPGDTTTKYVFNEYKDIVADMVAQYMVSAGDMVYENNADAKEAYNMCVRRVVSDLILKSGDHIRLFDKYMDDKKFRADLEDYAFSKAYTLTHMEKQPEYMHRISPGDIYEKQLDGGLIQKLRVQEITYMGNFSVESYFFRRSEKEPDWNNDDPWHYEIIDGDQFIKQIENGDCKWVGHYHPGNDEQEKVYEEIMSLINTEGHFVSYEGNLHYLSVNIGFAGEMNTCSVCLIQTNPDGSPIDHIDDFGEFAQTHKGEDFLKWVKQDKACFIDPKQKSRADEIIDSGKAKISHRDKEMPAAHTNSKTATAAI